MTLSRRRHVLALVLLAGAVAACGGGNEEASTAAPVAATGPADAQVVTVLGTDALDFEPAALSAEPGTLTITLGNEGGVPHNLVFDDTALEPIGTVGEGQEKSATYTFGAGGTYEFVCTFHPGMDGTLTVG